MIHYLVHFSCQTTRENSDANYFLTRHVPIETGEQVTELQKHLAQQFELSQKVSVTGDVIIHNIMRLPL